jgi:hypothetical protein
LILLRSDSVRLPRHDAPTVLDVLSATREGEKSGRPRDAQKMKDTLSMLRLAALNSIPDRTQNVTVELVCWMEMQKNG